MSCWCFPTLVLTQQLDHVHDRTSRSCGHLPLHILYLLTCFDTLPVYTESISSWDQNGLVFLGFFRWSLCPFSRLYGNKIYWPRGNRALLSFTTYTLRWSGSQCHREITLTAPTMNVQHMDIQYVIRVFYMEVKLQTFMVIGQWRGTIFSFQEGRKRETVWVSSMHMNWVMSHQNMFVMYNI